MRAWLVVLIVLLWPMAAASALVFPSDASVILTAERGDIVGVGKVVSGRTLDIQILQGFVGRARVAFVAFGEVLVLEVEVRGRGPTLPDGDLLLPDGTSVFGLLRTSGVEIAVVWAVVPLQAERMPGILGSTASETGLEHANPRAEEGGNPRSGEDNPGRRP